MKNFIILFCLLLILTIPKAKGQNYLINFTGYGKATTVSTVKVENLTKGTSLTLNGSDILRLTTATGVSKIEDNQSFELKIYPNPMTDNAKMEIFPPVEGNALISVYDITGKPVAQIQSYLENSKQTFLLSEMRSGFYIINVNGDHYQFSGKLISNVNSGGIIKIVKLNNIVQEAQNISAIATTNNVAASIIYSAPKTRKRHLL